VLVDPSERLAVGQLPMRVLPRLSASTPLYDMLKLFEAGGSHIALLIRQPHGPVGATSGGRPRTGSGAVAGSAAGLARARSGLIVSGALCVCVCGEIFLVWFGLGSIGCVVVLPAASALFDSPPPPPPPHSPNQATAHTSLRRLAAVRWMAVGVRVKRRGRPPVVGVT